VREILAEGHRTRDLAGRGEASISTSEMGELVAGRVRERTEAPAR
jgi:hypothetical protein